MTFDVGPEIWGKRLEFLKELFPGVSRVAFLWHPAFPGSGTQVRAAAEAARALGLTVGSVEVRGPGFT